MNLWRVASESPAGQSFAVLTVGVAVLILSAWMAERWIRPALWRRVVWRGALVATGTWIAAELLGGNALLARWVCLAPPRANAVGREARLSVQPEEVAGRGQGMTLPDWSPSNDQWLERLADLPADPLTEADLAWSQEDRSHLTPAEPNTAPLPPRGLPDSVLPSATGRSRNMHTAFGGTIPLFTFGWLGGAAVLLSWFFSRQVIVAWFTWRHVEPAPDALCDDAKKVFLRLSSHLAPRDRAPIANATQPCQPPDWSCGPMRLPCRVVQSRRLSAPVVYGVCRPTLAVPGDFGASLPRTQLHAVLAHELAHVIGRDPLWQVMFDALATILWWHPVVWLARARHKAACEAAADAGAAAIPGGSRALAAALVRLGRRISSDPRLGWAALEMSGRRRSRLGRRVFRLLSEPAAPGQGAVSRRGTVLSGAIVYVLVIALFLGTAVARSRVSGPVDSKGGSSMATWQSSWRSSLAAAALATLFGTAAAEDVPETEEVIEELIAAEVELVTEQAADVEEELQAELEFALEVEPQLELLFAIQEEEEEEEFESDEAEDDADEEEEDETEDDEGEGDDGDGEAEVEEDEEGREAERERQRAIIQLSRRAAAEAQAQQAKLAERMAKMHAELAGAKEKIAKENEKVAKQMQMLMQRAKAEAAQGKQGTAKALTDHIRQLQKLHGAEVHFAFTKEMPEAQRRIHHLTQAAENLRAIGKHDLAEQLMQEAHMAKEEELTRSERSPRDESAHGPFTAELMLSGEKAAEGEAPVHQLRQEMEELRSQVNDMRAMLERVVNRLDEGGDRDEAR